MSYLYSTFAQLVSVHCKSTAATSNLPINQCKRNLLNYGYEKLQTFSNEQLDAIDPYQRGASELIWSSIMREHPNSILITTRKPLPTPPATSIIILTHQNPEAKPAEDASAESTTKPTANYPKNPLFEGANENKHQFAMDMDIAYGYPSDKPAMKPTQVEIFDMKPAKVEEATAAAAEKAQETQNGQQQTQTFLTGPHVVRVRPDGTPVEEDQYQPLPRDDDLEAFQINTAVLLPPTPAAPTMQTIHAAAGRPTKHRKIATISALKQQYLKTLAIRQKMLPPARPMQELQPPLPRMHHQYPAAMAELLNYFA